MTKVGRALFILTSVRVSNYDRNLFNRWCSDGEGHSPSVWSCRCWRQQVRCISNAAVEGDLIANRWTCNARCICGAYPLSWWWLASFVTVPMWSVMVVCTKNYWKIWYR